MGAAAPLVLLPGTMCDERVFGPLRERLPGVETRVILTLGARTLSEAAERVLAQAPEEFALLGYSLGGMVAMEVALRAPERVRRLALLSTTPLAVPAERHEARRWAVEEARRMGLRQFVRERLWPDYGGGTEGAGTGGGGAGGGTSVELLEAMAEALGHGVFAQQTAMALAREDFRARLSAVRCPALVLAGAEDRMCPPAAQRELAEALPGSKCVMVPGAGHLALIENPDEVAAAVAAWCHSS